MKTQFFIYGFFLFTILCLDAQTIVETVSSGTSGDATLVVEADTDNNNENDNPKIMLKQDGSLVIGEIGLNGSSPQFTGALNNSMFIGSTTSANVPLQFINKNIAKMTLDSNGRLGIGTTTPTKELDVVGEITSSKGAAFGKINLTSVDGYSFLRLGPDANFYWNGDSGDGLSGGVKDLDNNYRKQFLFDVSGTYISYFNQSGQQFFNLSADENNEIKLVMPQENSRLAIGTLIQQDYHLAVAGKTITEEVKVLLETNWPDYVFENDYKLPSLKDVETHIKEKGRLKDIPSAEDVAKNGIFLGNMNAKLLQKIEELTLYTIEQEKKLENQETQLKYQNTQLKTQLEINQELKERLLKLEQLLLNKKQ